MDNNELKNIKILLNKCNINLKKVILKSFVEGIKIVNQKKILLLKLESIKMRPI